MRLALLVLSGTAYGLATAWLFRRFTKREPLSTAANRIIAHILEFNLFIDEPRLIFRAQRDLLRANFAMLQAVALPMLFAGAMLAVAWKPLAEHLGHAPLQAGDVTIARVASTADTLDLVAPFGVAVETPALRVQAEAATMWRIRALSPVNGDFRTVPKPLPVQIDYPTAKYFDMPWWVVFALVSTAVSVSAIGRKSGLPRPSAQ